MDMGRLPEAIAEARTAVQLDPLAPMTHNILGLGLWYAGKIDEAETVFRTALARDSSVEVVVGNLFVMYVSTGRTQEASALLAAQHDTSSLKHALVRAASDPAARRSALETLGRMRDSIWGGDPKSGSPAGTRAWARGRPRWPCSNRPWRSAIRDSK